MKLEMKKRCIKYKLCINEQKVVWFVLFGGSFDSLVG